ncbi:hypothetical protein NP233_g12441 [Leucocoprinus birnbaumii]|uniref:Nephrocystin 3-like N-terminal domain-containing protein n=1 Tax=Leucocoprinus birnbaumii TaxID=56174 RepID=A0AAD5VGB7_9AGAR|nr:hypothetical protein NP233_g12441 [Leucocoprinus birnbaumii]
MQSSFIDSLSVRLREPTTHDATQYYSAGGEYEPKNNPNAALDLSARDPPPRCHPGTRVRINEDLIAWLNSPDRDFDVRWLCGPSGTGKSAVAEACFELGRLGAAFFFSCLNGRDKSKIVIPSLVYQLCLHCPAYKSLVTEILANDPQPFVQLKIKGHPCCRQPLVIVLDGLDECAGIPAQSDRNLTCETTQFADRILSTTTQRIGVNNPLCILDALYTRILSNVPQEVLSTTLDILAQLALSSPHWSGKHVSAQVLCNVLRLEQHTFYGALAKLHSVILVPAPANACLESLRFCHASFPDYLLDTGRSGKFGITKSWAFEIIASRYLNWYGVLIASNNLNDFLNDFDFRYIDAHGRESVPWFVNWIHRHYPSHSILRTQPSYPIDFELLEHVKHLTGEKSVIPGVKLPFPDFGWFVFPAFNLSRELLFLGCGQKTVAVLFTRSRNPSIDVNNIEVGLSAELVSRYRRMIDQHDEPGWIEEIIEMFNEESLRDALE